MAPVLDAVAPKLKGQMAIGKIDCTQHKPLCNQYNVKGFPTLKYSIDGEVYDYPAGRDEKSLLAFAKKMDSPPITTIQRFDEATLFSQQNTDNGIAFLGTDKKRDGSKLYEIFSKVARKHQAAGFFLWLEQDPSDIKNGNKDSAFVHRVETGIVEPRQWEMEEMTFRALDSWVKEQNVPTLVTFGPENFQKISKKGRPLAMAVADLENPELVEALKAHMMDYILKAPQPIVDKYYYGLFDGKRWSKFLDQFQVKHEDNPQFLVLEMGANRKWNYWRDNSYSNFGDFMKAVWDESIPSKKPDKNGNGDSPFSFDMFIDYMPYSLVIVVVAVLVIVILVTMSQEDSRPIIKPSDVTNKDDQDESPSPNDDKALGEEEKKEK
jgi:hypothetical protein